MAKCTVTFKYRIGDQVSMLPENLRTPAETLTVEGQRNVDGGHAFYCRRPGHEYGVWIDVKALYDCTEEQGG